MKTGRVLHALFALFVVGAMLACSLVTQVLTGQTAKPPEQNTPSGEGEAQASPTGGQESSAPIVGTWKQVVVNGLTSPRHINLPFQVEFGGYYYFATEVEQVGLGAAEIWRTRDGITWETVGEPGLGDPKVYSMDICAWQDRLYVITLGADSFTLWISEDGKTFRPIDGAWPKEKASGVLRAVEGRLFLFVTSDEGLQIWQFTTAENLHKILEGGMGDPTSRGPGGGPARLDLHSLDGWSYIGIINSDKGGEVWRTKDGTTWERSLTGGFDNPAIPVVTPLRVFDGHVYAKATTYLMGMNLLRTGDGKQWEKVVENGFGLGAQQAYQGFLEELDSVLYLVTSNQEPRQWSSPSDYTESFKPTGFRLWKTSDGKTWQQVGKPGFGNPNYYFAGLSTIRGYMYLGATNYHDGNKVWRSSDGENWEEFFTAPVSPTTRAGAVGELGNSLLYIESDAVKGVQVWRYGP